MRALLATTAALAVMLSWYFVKEDEPAYEVAHRNVIRQCDHLVAEADSANNTWAIRAACWKEPAIGATRRTA
jgi:hypothetical protein